MLEFFHRPPITFVYGGRSSAELLPFWGQKKSREPSPDGRERETITYADPSTGLKVRVEITRFNDFPAIDWVAHFVNTGQTDSPTLDRILPLDLAVGIPDGDVVLHHAYGSTATATDFLPIDEPIAIGATVNLAPTGGRSSQGALPFFNLAWSGGGVTWAVGWSGQWFQQVQREASGTIKLKAGQQNFRARLHPGESIRTPRILLVDWRGDDRMRGHNLLRRLLLAHYVPRRYGQVVMPPVSQNTWFIYNAGNSTTEENQLRHIRALPALGGEVWWLDAGWFEGGWPRGVGNFTPNVAHFPHGLKPLADAAHQSGLKFLVWFETERITPASRTGQEHPEFVLGWKTGRTADGLFNLGNPAARAWLTDQLSKCIGNWGIDIYRTDFNRLQPLDFWQSADPPDREGITENHYVEGLYAMWDDLLRRHPRLVFDDCAAGGRRIDLEMISRSYNLSRSDTVCLPASSPPWDQAQTAGLSLFVPLNGTLSTSGLPRYEPLDRYALRSAATSGFSISQDNFAKGFPADLFRQVIAEVKMLRPLYNGDFYPLTSINVDDGVWCAWQFDRPELGRGFAMFFRRAQSPHPAIEVALHGLDPSGEYEVTIVDRAKTQRLTGAQLANLRVEIAAAPGSMLVTYRRLEVNPVAPSP